MWTREQIKGNAKYVLGFSYWKALLACLIVSILTGISQSGSSNTFVFRFSHETDYVFSWRIAPFVILTISFLALLGILFGIFVTNPIQVGQCRFFIANRQNRGAFDQLFSLFRNGTYLNVVKIMFLRDLYTALWSLLFLIPGIVKSYEYRMIPYILAENPNIQSTRAFAMTKEMTQGEKGAIFVLDLSFLGWNLLGLMACGIGVLFVLPYEQATYAELYEILKYQLISAGRADANELGGLHGYTGEPRRWNAPPYAQTNGYGYSGQQPGYTGQQPGYTGQRPGYTGQQPGFTGQQPSAPQPPQPAQPADGTASWFEQQIEQEKKSGDSMSDDQ